jgi:putative transposase
MARKARVEFEGGVYHLLDCGDRREPIVRSDADRAAFVRTLGEACARTGWRVHAWVLMSNHYHLLIETMQESRPSISPGSSLPSLEGRPWWRPPS